MEMHDFNLQIDRLKSVFGDRFYPDERVKLIWKQMGWLERSLFDRLVERLISNHRTPPMGREMDEELYRLKEEERARERQREKKDAKDFWEETFHPDETKWIIEKIKARMLGQISDSEWEEFKKILDATKKSTDQQEWKRQS